MGKEFLLPPFEELDEIEDFEEIESPLSKDEDWETDYGTLSCDKGGHKDRSIANQPNHLKHWKKVNDQS